MDEYHMYYEQSYAIELVGSSSLEIHFHVLY